MTGLNAYRPYRNLPRAELEAMIESMADADRATDITRHGITDMVRSCPLNMAIDIADELHMRGPLDKCGTV